jgi:4-amino-4-deoxy-L-arabinose transferase-like glycosyltransferase
MNARRSLSEFSILVLLLLTLGVPRFPGLGRFVTADEPTWGKRSASFYYALSNEEYETTYQSPHPGVTTMWAGAAAYFLKFPNYQRVGLPEIGDTRLFQVFQRHGPIPMEVMAQARWFVVGIHVLVLGLCFYLLRPVFGTWISLLGIILIGFDPFFLSHSRLLQLDGLLSSFMFLSICGWLLFLKNRSWSALAISGTGAGLAFLTKTPAVVLILAVGILALLRLPGDRSTRLPARFSRYLREGFLPLVAWGMAAAVIFIALWPAMWVQPMETLGKMAAYSLSSAAGEVGGAQFVEAFEAEEGEESPYLYFYPLTYLWRSTPVVLLGLLLAGAALWFKQPPLEDGDRRKAAFGMLAFSLLFLALMSLGSKKIDRYLLPVYLPLNLVAATGWWAGYRWLTARFSSIRKQLLLLLFGVLIMGGQAAASLSHFPYYLTYYNPLLGGIGKAQNVLMVGWGEGLNEAALYLRQKPDVKQLNLLSWYPLAFNWYSSSFRFTSGTIPFPSDKIEVEAENYLAADYIVVYVNQWQRRIPEALFDLLEDRAPEHTIRIKGIEYVRIYRLRP